MSAKSFWEANCLEQKVIQVLERITYFNASHHFGRPFVTAYQLAILFKQRFPDEFDAFGHPLGGMGSGAQFSLTSYLAGQLSKRIGNGEITSVEGRFLSNRQLLGIRFDDHGETITSSLTNSQYDVSMFRLRDSNT